MKKKQIALVIVFNIFLVFLGGIILRWITRQTITTQLAKTNTTVTPPASSSSLAGLQSSLVDMLAEAKKPIVHIHISKDVKFYVDDPAQLNGPGTIQQQTTTLWWGSGIIISKKWYIITNKHVVQDTTAKYSVSTYDGITYNVDKIWFDDLLDIAVLRIADTKNNNLKHIIPARFLPLATRVDVGQLVFSLGNVLSNSPYTVTMGILWSKNKQFIINQKNLYIWLYQTDAQANPGNSGGPLLDIDGTTLWIVTAIAEWEGMSFALPISQEFIESTISSIESLWSLSRPVLGIQYVEITPEIQAEKNIASDHGIYVTDVIADLPAQKAWLQIGDSIISMNDTPIHTDLPFLYQLYTHTPWETIDLEIIRDTSHLHLSIDLWGNTQ